MKVNDSLLASNSTTVLTINDPPEPKTLSHSLRTLLNSDRSLFLIFLINLCSSVQFYILVTLIPLHFSSAHSFTDTTSGMVFGVFGVVIGSLSVYLSYLMSKISLKRGLFLSFTVGIIGFGLMLSNDLYLCLIAIVLFHGVSCAIAWPYAEYAVKEYSDEEIWNLSSSCFFISNYIAGIATGFFLEYLWSALNNELLVYKYSCYTGIGFLLIGVISLKFCKPIHEIKTDLIDSEGLFSCRRFLRFTCLIVFMVLLRSSSFGHLDATLPKYLIRTKGSSAHFGLMLSIHSITMIVGLVTLTALTYFFKSYDLICVGAVIGSLGSLFVILSDDLLAFIGLVIFISVGESIWVPRLLDYTFKVAPKGKEGIYLAMSNCPFYFGMILTGSESGLLFEAFCPDDSDLSSCGGIWVLVLVSSLLISLLVILLKQFLVEPELPEENHELDYKKIDN